MRSSSHTHGKYLTALDDSGDRTKTLMCNICMYYRLKTISSGRHLCVTSGRPYFFFPLLMSPQYAATPYQRCKPVVAPKPTLYVYLYPLYTVQSEYLPRNVCGLRSRGPYPPPPSTVPRNIDLADDVDLQLGLFAVQSYLLLAFLSQPGHLDMIDDVVKEHVSLSGSFSPLLYYFYVFLSCFTCRAKDTPSPFSNLATRRLPS